MKLLTERERRVVALLAEVMNELRHVVGDGPTRNADLNELVRPVHELQNAVLAQAAARAHPRTYRLLGKTLRED